MPDRTAVRVHRRRGLPSVWLQVAPRRARRASRRPSRPSEVEHRPATTAQLPSSIRAANSSGTRNAAGSTTQRRNGGIRATFAAVDIPQPSTVPMLTWTAALRSVSSAWRSVRYGKVRVIAKVCAVGDDLEVGGLRLPGPYRLNGLGERHARAAGRACGQPQSDALRCFLALARRGGLAHAVDGPRRRISGKQVGLLR